ncbi:iron-containing alcohol dehydrogenase [Paenibacillus piri]|uniref:Iron-containing alcohol dehydrogenase n=1 Tax=Paenibacillus piri TaxID=2547395 RepID=A0A4R5KXC8_9BACL|nr:iron-containing alcohol dehydrogenase [Paenibacillus piri]TDG00684.1 iron-containing alcohol dehydrogenase [Paenibacillus piri]
MNLFNRLLLPETIVCGAHAFERLGACAAGMGSKALIISDPVMEKLGLVRRCAQLLEAASIASASYTGVDTEPTDRHVAEGLERCREQACRFIVAVGGGSCLDTAKAVAVMVNNDGYIGDYAGGKRRFEQPPLPLIAIPTTAGTGSEVTKVTVITSTATDEKMMIAQPELLPHTALVDPLLTVSCPPATTAATGIDALCHAVEAYLSRKANPLTDALALAAARDLSANMLRAYEHGGDLAAREKMMTGAMIAGAAFSNASVALVHGMSRPIGAQFHVPHGISNAMLFAAVLEFSLRDALPRLAELGRAMLPELTAERPTEAQWAAAVIAEIKRLCKAMQIPNLRQWGIEREAFLRALPRMADDAIKSGSPANNPTIPDRTEIIELYKRCYDYDFN